MYSTTNQQNWSYKGVGVYWGVLLRGYYYSYTLCNCRRINNQYIKLIMQLGVHVSMETNYQHACKCIGQQPVVPVVPVDTSVWSVCETGAWVGHTPVL